MEWEASPRKRFWSPSLERHNREHVKKPVHHLMRTICPAASVVCVGAWTWKYGARRVRYLLQVPKRQALRRGDLPPYVAVLNLTGIPRAIPIQFHSLAENRIQARRKNNPRLVFDRSFPLLYSCHDASPLSCNIAVSLEISATDYGSPLPCDYNLPS